MRYVFKVPRLSFGVWARHQLTITVGDSAKYHATAKYNYAVLKIHDTTSHALKDFSRCIFTFSAKAHKRFILRPSWAFTLSLHPKLELKVTLSLPASKDNYGFNKRLKQFCAGCIIFVAAQRYKRDNGFLTNGIIRIRYAIFHHYDE